MFHTFNRKFNREMTIIHPGEYSAGSEDIIICTILGSCVSVILIDAKKPCSGMNHFMLASGHGKHMPIEDLSGRYGVNAMELLINDMMKHGSDRSSLTAKVFGGGHVIDTQNTNAIPETNVQFALDFLEAERIPVVSQDTGGVHGRNLLLFARTGQVLLKRFTGNLASRAAQEELEYLEKLRARQQKPVSDITLF